LNLSPHQIRSFVKAGCVKPTRGPRGTHRFSFQDLVLLRTARDLARHFPHRKVLSALRKLRRQLPTGRDLTGVRIAAHGNHIVVQDGSLVWNPESGQSIFDFEVSKLAAKVAPIARKAVREAQLAEEELCADDWHELGCDLEAIDPNQARDAYRRALELDPIHPEARVNLGKLLRESGTLKAAEMHFRLALAAQPKSSSAALELGAVYEDLRRPELAIKAYEKAIRSDPGCAEAHHHTARILEKLGKSRAALQHLKTYRKLTGSKP